MDLINRIINAVTQVHPTHPMFVHFPIALTGAAFLFILLAYWRKSVMFEQGALLNIALASFGTVVAGLTGAMDNVRNYDGGAPNAGAKIILAFLLLILTASISVVRYRQPGSVPKGESVPLCCMLWLVLFHRARACISGWRHYYTVSRREVQI